MDSKRSKTVTLTESVADPLVAVEAISSNASAYVSRNLEKEREDKEDEIIVMGYLITLGERLLDTIDNPDIDISTVNNKRDSFWMIYTNVYGNNNTGLGGCDLGMGMNFNIEQDPNFKDLASKDLPDYQSAQNGLSLLIFGDVVNVIDLLNYDLHDEMSTLIRSTGIQARELSIPNTSAHFMETGLHKPASILSEEVRSLMIIPKISIEEDFKSYVERNLPFKAILELDCETDTPAFLVKEKQWNKLEPKHQDELLQELESFHMFLPLHHVKYDGKRDLSSPYSRVQPPSNFDKAFNALVYFNKTIAQQFINEINTSIPTGRILCTHIDSPLGWTGEQKVTNLFPLNDFRRPIFVSHCSNIHVMAIKIIFSKLVAQLLGSWAALRIAPFEHCLKALQLGDWHFEGAPLHRRNLQKSDWDRLL